MQNFYETDAKRMKNEGGEGTCVVKHRTQCHPAPHVPKPKREAQGPENHAFRLRRARTSVRTIDGTGGRFGAP